MELADLEAYVDRSTALVEASPEMSVRNTELRLVQPFLATLGWDVATEVEAEFRVGDAGTATYALLVDDDPVVLVETVACGEPLTPTAGDRLTTLLDAGDVDWGLVTNGRTFLLYARDTDGAFEAARVDLRDLPDRRDDVANYTRAAARDRATDRERAAADRLVERHDYLVESVTATLTDVGGTAHEERFREATETFLADLHRSLVADDSDATAEGRHDTPTPADRQRRRSPSDDHDVDESAGTAGDPEGDSSTRSAGSTSAETATRASTDTVDDPPDETGGRTTTAGDVRQVEVVETVASAPPGEYVTRFFDDRTSVGAVGQDHADSAAAQAIEYLMDRHALNNRLDLPWGPNDERIAVINRDPVHRDGTEMSTARQLRDGYFLYTGISVAQMREVIEYLADRCGLRVMFQGEWA